MNKLKTLLATTATALLLATGANAQDTASQRSITETEGSGMKTKILRNAGGDLGAAVSNFKNQMKTGEEEVTGDPEKLEQADAEFEQSNTAAKESAKSDSKTS